MDTVWRWLLAKMPVTNSIRILKNFDGDSYVTRTTIKKEKYVVLETKRSSAFYKYVKMMTNRNGLIGDLLKSIDHKMKDETELDDDESDGKDSSDEESDESEGEENVEEVEETARMESELENGKDEPTQLVLEMGNVRNRFSSPSKPQTKEEKPDYKPTEDQSEDGLAEVVVSMSTIAGYRLQKMIYDVDSYLTLKYMNKLKVKDGEHKTQQIPFLYANLEQDCNDALKHMQVIHLLIESAREFATAKLKTPGITDIERLQSERVIKMYNQLEIRYKELLSNIVIPDEVKEQSHNNKKDEEGLGGILYPESSSDEYPNKNSVNQNGKPPLVQKINK
jgi:hypothetical protein